MRRTTPMRWIEEAEARRVWLYDTESKPAAAENVAAPEFRVVPKTALTVLVARMTGRVARAARGRASAGEEDAPAEGCDETWIWSELAAGAPYLMSGASSAVTEAPAYASSYSRETPLVG